MLTLLLDLVCHRFYLPPAFTHVRETEVPNIGWKKAFKGEEQSVHALWMLLVILGWELARYASLIYHCCISAGWLSQYSGWYTGRSTRESGFDSR